MWLAVKIGVFYGVPAIALLLAVAYFVVLLMRVRRGIIDRRKAAMFYPITLLLPGAVVIMVWATAELASYLTVGSGRYIWDGGAAVQLLIGLLPIAGYVGVPIAALVVAFWLALAWWKRR